MIPIWLAVMMCSATLGLERLVLWLIHLIWPPVVVVPEGAEIDLDALMNGHRILIVPSKPQRWSFK